MKKLLLSAFLIIIGIGAMVSPGLAQAGNNVELTCSGQGTCQVSPSNTPLFQEAEWSPGSSVTQKLRVTNMSAQKSKLALQLQNYQDPRNLGRAVSFAIRETS